MRNMLRNMSKSIIFNSHIFLMWHFILTIDNPLSDCICFKSKDLNQSFWELTFWRLNCSFYILTYRKKSVINIINECPSKPRQWASVHSTMTLNLKQLNDYKWINLIIYTLLWYVKLKKAYSTTTLFKKNLNTMSTYWLFQAQITVF